MKAFNKAKKYYQDLNLEERLCPGAQLTINASLAYYEGRLFCIYRTDNLDKYDARNYITEFDDDFEPLSHDKLISGNGNTAIEDIRLFSFKGELLAFYTYLPQDDVGSWLFHYGIGMGKVDLNTKTIIRQQSLRKYAKGLHSKNWIPYEYGGELFLMTDIDPEVRILKGKIKGDHFEFEQYYTKTNNLSDWWKLGQIRGGTPFIMHPQKLNNWLYSFAHSHVVLPNGFLGSRFYFSIPVRFDPLTMEFQMSTVNIEHSENVAGIDHHTLWKHATKGNMTKVIFPMSTIQYGDNLILSYGKDDCISKIRIYDWSEIISWF